MSVTKKPKVCHVDTLAGHFETQFDNLPTDIRALVEKAYWAGDWDTLPPEQRLKLAWQYDTPETDGQRLEHMHLLIEQSDYIKGLVPTTVADCDQRDASIQSRNIRIQKTGVLLVSDYLARVQNMKTPSAFELGWQKAENRRINDLIAKAEKPPFDPEAPALGSSARGTTKPIQLGHAQDAAIIAAIGAAGYDPLVLPKNEPGKPGIKAATRAALVGSVPVFPKEGKQFEKAWDRLRSTGEIVDKP